MCRYVGKTGKSQIRSGWLACDDFGDGFKLQIVAVDKVQNLQSINYGSERELQRESDDKKLFLSLIWSQAWSMF